MAYQDSRQTSHDADFDASAPARRTSLHRKDGVIG